MEDGYAGYPFAEQQIFSDHQQVQVTGPEGILIVVDHGLERLLLQLWKQGYRTRWSCQGGFADSNLRPHEAKLRGYIYFETDDMAKKFAKLINDESSSKKNLCHKDILPVVRFPHESIVEMEKIFQTSS